MNPNNKLIDIVGILEIIWIANLGGKSRCAMIFMWFLHTYIYIYMVLFVSIYYPHFNFGVHGGGKCWGAQGKGNNDFKLSPRVFDTYVLLNHLIF